MRSLFLALVVAVVVTACGSAPGVQTGDPDGGSNTQTPATTTCPEGTIGTAPECYPLPPVPAASGKQWKLTFQEEFAGSTYDAAKLTPCFDWNTGDCTSTFNNGRETYRPEQIRVSDGTAKMVIEPLSPAKASSNCFNGQCTYAAGLLSTARPRANNGSGYLYTFTYGYVETRLKFPAIQGFFTAFWMLPAEPSYNYATEIDIVEILGDDPSTIWMHYHYNDRSSYHRVNSGAKNNGACAVKNYAENFVRFGLDWQPTHVAWYIDGVKCGQFNGTTAQVESGPMQLILNNMVDNNWIRSTNVPLQNQSTVGQMEVDYIRVYQQQ